VTAKPKKSLMTVRIAKKETKSLNSSCRPSSSLSMLEKKE
jgi:hypothetical protein